MWIDSDGCTETWHKIDSDGCVVHADGKPCELTQYGDYDES